MPRISNETRQRNEDAIRDAMGRLLRGELPPGGRCDLKTLAAEAGVPRTGFYPKKDRSGKERPGPYQHLATEFERRVAGLREAGDIPDPREAQIERLKQEKASLQERLAARNTQVTELTEFRTLAISRIAAQHAEIIRLREALKRPDNVRPIAGGLPGAPHAPQP